MEALAITDTGFPVATRSLLADHEVLGAHHAPEEINQPLFALIKARKALNDARLCCRYARALNKDRVAVTEILDTLSRELAAMQERFPLTILDNAPHRPRPPIIRG